MAWRGLRNISCMFFYLLVFFHEAHGVSFSSEPNKTIVAFAGYNKTFTWKLNIAAENKIKELKAQFGPWDKKYSLVHLFLITFVREPAGKEIEIKANHSMAKRLFWMGDLARNDFVTFQLTNVQHQDAGNYGVRFRVDDFPPLTIESWFSLYVEDPPVKPTVDTRNITLAVVEGKDLNITCRIIMEGNPNVLWMRDNIPVRSGQSKFLFIKSVNRSQAGNYVCVSMSRNGNRTSPITTVNVLYKPSTHTTNKVVSVFALKESVTRLKCEADGNPPATFHWYKNSVEISKGFNSTWNSSTLTIVPTKDEDFARYVCTARNKVGWDAITFNLYEEVAETLKSEVATKGDDTSSLMKYLSLSAVLVVILICGIICLGYVVRRYRRPANHRKDEDSDNTRTQTFEIVADELSQRGANSSALNQSFSGDIEWEIPRANLNVEKVIGRGAFGVVSRGLALDLPGKPGWTVVAVKSVLDDASEKEKRDLLSEMSVLKHLDPHPHVIRLYGCISTEDRPLVVVEYAQYGDLLGYLRKSRGVRDNYYSDPSVKPATSLTSQQLLKFAWEISDGMLYLSKKKIIHRDLAARNVLVGDEEVCKITDFGMARDVQEEDIYVRTHEGRLPIKWTAPEALFGGGAYTTASDVWSYGVVLYEIFTVGGDPFPGVCMRDIPALLKDGYRMSRPKFVSPKLHEIMMECWQSDPRHRPTFASLRSTLHKMKEEEEQEYVNLKELFYENVLPSSC